MPRFAITPIPKPRMTQADRWRDRPAVSRYWAFKDELNLLAQQAGFELGECFMAVFYIPMPPSWSRAKKLRMLNQPHRTTPDTDNLIKAVADSLLPDDDAGIWFECGAKFWAFEGAIEIVNLTPAEARYILVRKDIKRDGSL